MYNVQVKVFISSSVSVNRHLPLFVMSERQILKLAEFVNKVQDAQFEGLSCYNSQYILFDITGMSMYIY